MMATTFAAAAAMNQNAAPKLQAEQVQCLSCGEFVNSVNGGYPKFCRFCKEPFGDLVLAPTEPALNGSAPVVVEEEEDGLPNPSQKTAKARK